MQIRNSNNAYGAVSRFFHWIMALAIFAMFGLGLWMVELDLYDPWYKAAPYLHQSFGIILLAMLLARLIWRQINLRSDDSYLSPFERRMSHLVHLTFYALLAIMMTAGYLILTVDGRSIDVFGLFPVPSLYEHKGLEETAGLVHQYLAYMIILLAVIHMFAALKHHFVNHDATLSRMWREKPRT